MTRRSDEVYICSQKRMTISGYICKSQGPERTFTLLRTSLSARFFSSPTHVRQEINHIRTQNGYVFLHVLP